MASTNKTPGLFLNKWLGSDKPKRDDFNEDNDKLDAAFGGLSARAQSAEGTLAAHTGNGNIHVTAAEKALWGQGGSGGGGTGGGSGAEIGTYVGTGTSSQTVTLGFRPRFGFLFATNNRIVDGDWSNGRCYIYAGFFSEMGSSVHIELTATGFIAKHQANPAVNGSEIKFNQSGVTYVYVVWR